MSTGCRGAGPRRAAVVEDRHLLRLDAILRSYEGRVGASHQSSVLAWGLPVLVTTLERVHVAHVRRGATGRRHGTFTIHTCEHEGAFTRHDARTVVVPPLAVLGTASSCGLKAGLVAVEVRSGPAGRRRRS